MTDLKSRTARISLFVICVEAVIYLLLYKLHDCTVKGIDEKLPQKLFVVAKFSLFYQIRVFIVTKYIIYKHYIHVA